MTAAGVFACADCLAVLRSGRRRRSRKPDAVTERASRLREDENMSQTFLEYSILECGRTNQTVGAGHESSEGRQHRFDDRLAKLSEDRGMLSQPLDDRERGVHKLVRPRRP